MDIQDTKEQRQAFEAWCIQWNIASVFPLDDEGQYSDYNIHLLYCAWLQGQATKAQAVTEGFVLVERSKLLQILGSAVAINTNPKTKINLLESDFIIGELKAMIEAQRQSHE